MGTNSKTRVNVGVDKEDIASRIARAANVRTTAPKSAIYQNDPEVKSCCDRLVTCGTKVATLAESIETSTLALAKLHSEQIAAVVDYDAAHKVAVGHVEQRATKPEDVQGLGFEVADRTSHDIAPPVAVSVKYDRAKKDIGVRIKRAPGMKHCVTEISDNAVEPRVWTRLPGLASVRKIGNLAPGSYAVRAASVRATEESVFTTPVFVIVD